MTTTAGTGPADVRVEIDTELDDPDINDILARVERDVDREYGSGTGPFDDTQHRVDFEATLAAYRIGTGRDPRASDEAVGNIQVTYDVSVADHLRERVQFLDPGDMFPGRGGAVRDSDRYIGSTDL